MIKEDRYVARRDELNDMRYELENLMAESPEAEVLVLLVYRLESMSKERVEMVKMNIAAGLELKVLQRQLLDLHDAFVALRKEKEALEIKLKEYEDNDTTDTDP